MCSWFSFSCVLCALSASNISNEDSSSVEFGQTPSTSVQNFIVFFRMCTAFVDRFRTQSCDCMSIPENMQCLQTGKGWWLQFGLTLFRWPWSARGVAHRLNCATGLHQERTVPHDSTTRSTQTCIHTHRQAVCMRTLRDLCRCLVRNACFCGCVFRHVSVSVSA